MGNKFPLSITFAGGARKVTGSQFLVETRSGERTVRILIDCGLEQGARFCESSNNDRFSYDPKTIDAVLVTHAHADHIGLLPKLVKEGYTGPVYTTAATADLIPVMLEDSVDLTVREAHACDDEPPYTKEHVDQLPQLIEPVDYRTVVQIAPGITAEFYNAGHILGSALIVLTLQGTRVLFTGDLGRTPALLVPDPEVPEHIDYLVTESVYGARVHESAETSAHALCRAIHMVQKKNGTLLIPSFSLERTQLILNTIDRLLSEERIAALPVFLDSPLAARVTDVYKKHTAFLRKGVLDSSPFSFNTLRVTYTNEESKDIDATPGPKVIIAGAGMSHGGRVRNHEKTYLPDPASLLLLVGYQVPGSLGRRLQDGAREVMIGRKKVKVRATVTKTSGFSAHADRDDLLAFAEKVNPKKVFVVLGEMEQSSFLAQRISGFLGIETYIPQKGERIALDI